MAVVKPKLSYDYLLELPESTDGRRYELFDGELYVSPSPVPRHQAASIVLSAFVFRAQQAGYGKVYAAPIDVVFDDLNVVVPDLIFVRSERLSIVTSANVQGPPDLIVEILSPGTQKHDLTVKLQMYARFRVPHYWVPAPVGEVIRRFELRGSEYVELPVLRGQDILSSPLFPGIEMPVSEIFA
jgi:Uma2 family endonuclease